MDVSDSHGNPSERNIFKEWFKLFTRKQKTINYNLILDFDSESFGEDVIRIEPKSVNQPHLECFYPLPEWKIFGHKNYPGFVFIKNPFRHGAAFYWIRRCLHDLPRNPNVTNLTNIKSSHSTKNADKFFAVDDFITVENGTANTRNSINNTCLWCNKNDFVNEMKEKWVRNLRWTTLGYHHNWDTKVYSYDSYTPFPEDLSILCKYIAAAIGYNSYRAEAAIINYYHEDSTMSGHRDCSEEDKEAPLISISFGLPAIFLLGGVTRADTPLAMFIRSGDIVIMMNESRLAYHAVPRVLDDGYKVPLSPNHISNNTETMQLEISEGKQANICNNCKTENNNVSSSADFNKLIEETNQTYDWTPYTDYISNARININVRQVFKM